MEKIKVGDTYIHNTNFTQERVNVFAQVTGDNNPIHIDEAYAAQTPFGRPIVHGFFAGSVFSKVFGTLFPGEGTIYMYQEMAFLSPVFVGTDYKAKFEVVEVNSEKHRAVVKCTLEDSDGKIAISGQAKLMHKERF
ncbi:MAG: MaoC family dehydratase [Bacteroidales bacterium]|jgi:acyl dehydratase|nr:MaoC family dehydratase [Bacteroidales bacterium]